MTLSELLKQIEAGKKPKLDELELDLSKSEIQAAIKVVVRLIVRDLTGAKA